MSDSLSDRAAPADARPTDLSAAMPCPRPRPSSAVRRPRLAPFVLVAALALSAGCDRSGGGQETPTGNPVAATPPQAVETDTSVQLGPLSGRWLGGIDGAGGGEGPVIVLLHGYGAGPDDLASVAQRLRVPPSYRFVLLAGPLRLPQGGRAWWPLDLEERRRVIESGELRDLSGELPDGLEEARAQLLQALAALRQRADVDPHAIAVVGFSQGAMAATDLALFADPRIQALGILSGTLLAEDVWRDRALRTKGIPTFIAHGRRDDLLPFEMADRLREMLDESRLDVRWHPHEGGHEIPRETLRALGTFLTDVFGTLVGR